MAPPFDPHSSQLPPPTCPIFPPQFPCQPSPHGATLPANMGFFGVSYLMYPIFPQHSETRSRLPTPSSFPHVVKPSSRRLLRVGGLGPCVPLRPTFSDGAGPHSDQSRFHWIPPRQEIPRLQSHVIDDALLILRAAKCERPAGRRERGQKGREQDATTVGQPPSRTTRLHHGGGGGA